MTDKEKAAKAGISPPYFSLIKNGRVGVSATLAERWKDWSGHTHEWWNKATTSQKQKCFERLEAA